MTKRTKITLRTIWLHHRHAWLFVAYVITVLTALLLATIDLLLFEAKIEDPDVAGTTRSLAVGLRYDRSIGASG